MGFEFVGLVTNGRRLADRSFASAIVDAGLHGITFSLLGHDARTHDTMAAVSGAFDALRTGLRNVSELARERMRPLSVSANIVVTAQNLDTLDQHMAVLAECGASAAVLHLVRFSHMAQDPTVREMIRLTGRDLAPSIARAFAAAEKLGIHLHTDAVPQCMQTRMEPSALRRLAHRGSVVQHRFTAAALEYDLNPERSEFVSHCADCLLVRACPRIADEHVDRSSPPFHPITAAHLANQLDDRLASLDPNEASSVAELASHRDALGLIESIAQQGHVLSPLVDRIDEAIGDLMSIAFSRRDVLTLAAASTTLLGLAPAPGVFARDEWRQMVARAARAERREAAPDATALLVGDVAELLIEGTQLDGERYRVDRVIGLRPQRIDADPKTRSTMRMHLVMLSVLEATASEATLIEVTPDGLAMHLDHKPTQRWRTTRAGVFRWRPGPAPNTAAMSTRS
jgi:hypothetical protein